MRLQLALAAGWLSAATIVSAQTIRGSVVDGALRPLAGVVVLLVDSAGTTIARTITRPGGEYHFTVGIPGTFRLRSLRLGFRPTTTAPLTLEPDENVQKDLELAGLPVSLDTVRVTGRNPCLLQPDSARATYSVWEQVRTVLLAVQLTAEQKAATRILGYRRSLDPRTGQVISQSLAVNEDTAAQPWSGLSADSLHRSGYVHVGVDGVTTFHAPDLGVLLSDGFAQDHCFRLATDPNSRLIGLAFEPIRERRRLPEVMGTMWVDRATAQLRRLEFRYANVAADLERAEAGGALEFARTRAGSWVIARWHIRMPIVENERVRVTARSRGRRLDTWVRQIRVEGGELVLMTLATGTATDTLFARVPMTMSGSVRDAVSGRPIAGARVLVLGTTSGAITDATGAFRLANILPGRYTLGVHTGALDSLGARYSMPYEFMDTTAAADVALPPAAQVAATLCSAAGLTAPLDGVLSGTVHIAADLLPAFDARVVAEWRDQAGGPGAPGRARWLDARTDAQGRFRICGAPTDAAIVLRAESGARAAAIVAPSLSVHLSPIRRFVNVELSLQRADRSQGGTLEGVILSEIDARPIPDVEVAIPALGKNAFSNDRGEYRLTDVPAGAHVVVARRLGYKQVQLTLAFEAGRTTERRILMSRVVMLDTVAVRASPRDQMMREFEDNRRLGLGKFWTRADLEKLEGVPMSGILSQINGSRVVRGRRGSYAWIVRSRGVLSLGGSTGTAINPSQEDAMLGAPRACYPTVWVDNVRVYSGRDEEPLFNLNSIQAADIEAMEFYASPAQTPARYTGLNTVCGALVIWTRR